MTVRTRFAPSPTGYLHIGGLRTALYALSLIHIYHIDLRSSFLYPALMGLIAMAALMGVRALNRRKSAKAMAEQVDASTGNF